MVIILPDLQALASAPIFASIIVHPSPAAGVIFQSVSVQTLVLRQVSTSKHNRLLHGQDIFRASSCLSSFNSACHVPHSCYPSLISGLAAPTTLQAHASLGASVLLFLLCVWLLQPTSGGFSVTSSDRLVREDLTKTPAQHSLSIHSSSFFFSRAPGLVVWYPTPPPHRWVSVLSPTPTLVHSLVSRDRSSVIT